MSVILKPDVSDTRQISECGAELVRGPIRILIGFTPLLDIHLQYLDVVEYSRDHRAITDELQLVPLTWGPGGVFRRRSGIVQSATIVCPDFLFAVRVQDLDLESALNRVFRIGTEKYPAVAFL